MTSEFIYFVQAVGGGPIKIGYTTDPVKRLGLLQSSSPYELCLLAAIPGTPRDERLAHHRFHHRRIRGEWFADCPEIQEFLLAETQVAA